MQKTTIYKLGNGYWKTSKLASIEMARTNDFDFVSPILVNIAFATELYLKHLLELRTGKMKKTHSLDLLFQDLPASDKAKINKIYINRLSNSKIHKTIFTNHPDVDFSLESVLSEIKDTFINWRYSFEKRPNSTQGLGIFADSLKEYIETI